MLLPRWTQLNWSSGPCRWGFWDQNVTALRPACARSRTFLRLGVVLAAMTVRRDRAGGPSLGRSHGLRASCAHRLLSVFHSPALDPPKRIGPWTALVLRRFAPPLVRVGGRIVRLADGLKAPKEGRTLPAVKSLHQQSAGNPKPTWSLGHCGPAVALLGQAAGGCRAGPLAGRSHEGIVFSNRGRRSLLDKLVGLLLALGGSAAFSLVAGASYASRKVALPRLGAGPHLITRLRSTASAFDAVAPSAPRRRGRPQRAGRKMKLRALFPQDAGFGSAPSPVDGERDVTVRSGSVDLRWRPLGQRARVVLVDHPTRGRLIRLSPALALDPLAILQLDGWRCKSEVGFKPAIPTVGTSA